MKISGKYMQLEKNTLNGKTQTQSDKYCKLSVFSYEDPSLNSVFNMSTCGNQEARKVTLGEATCLKGERILEHG